MGKQVLTVAIMCLVCLLDWSLLPPELNITIKRRKRRGDGIKTAPLPKKIVTNQGAIQLEVQI